MQTNKLNEQLKTDIIQEVCELLGQRYIFPNIAQKIIKELKGNFESGKFKDIKDLPSLGMTLDTIFQKISQDKHLHILYDPENLKNIIGPKSKIKDKKIQHQEDFELGKTQNFGFVKVEILDGNIGLLDLRRFYHPKIQEAGDVALSAMSFLKNTNAIIIDLRNNGGGEPEMAQLLASYFFKNRTRLNTIDRPYEGYSEQWWTFPYIPGKAHYNNALYILTSKTTFSAAEDFTYALQCQNRVTVVGEITKGGAHPVDFFTLLNLLVLMLPTARTFNTVTNDNWEGKGIRPDIEVRSEDAFDTAYLIALKNISTRIEMNENERIYLKIIIKELEVIKNRNQPPPSLSTLNKYVGTYGNARIELHENTLHYIIEGVCELRLVPVSEELFEPEGSPNERVYFEYNPETNEIRRHWLYKMEREVFTKIKAS